MGQVSTDTRVSHHTGDLGTDKDTPQGLHLSKEKRAPNNKEKGTKDSQVFIVITLQKKKYPLFFAKNV